MGTGKTTVGRTVAYRIGFKCVDSDHEIERKAGKPVARIFSEDGEPAFRKLERRFIEDGHAAEKVVVACGGGLVVQEGMLALLSRKGVVVCLHA
jgi:shikimate kinase